jgi:ketosteroid isomerase-like protein
MTDAAAARSWVEGYVRAWRSNDRGEIGVLFTDDATYRASPDGEPVAGREAIVDWWLENADAPDETTFSFDVIGTDGPRAFVQGVTVYRAKEDRPARTYDNLWVIDITDEGRASAFTEWYVRRRD